MQGLVIFLCTQFAPVLYLHSTTFCDPISTRCGLSKDHPPYSKCYFCSVQIETKEHCVHSHINLLLFKVARVHVYHSVPGKCPWALKCDSRFRFAWALTRDINCMHLYGSCYTDPLKFGTWACLPGSGHLPRTPQ